MIGQQGHYPYGETWYAANTTSKFIFTSYERDLVSSNDYAMARFFVDRFGRFCSADPILGSPSNPQSWNRYGYVQNDPINRVDPSGTFGFLAILITLIVSFLNSLFLNVWAHGIGLHTPVIFGNPVPSISIGTPPTFPNRGGIDWHTLLPGSDPHNTVITNFNGPDPIFSKKRYMIPMGHSSTNATDSCVVVKCEGARKLQRSYFSASQ